MVSVHNAVPNKANDRLLMNMRYVCDYCYLTYWLQD